MWVTVATWTCPFVGCAVTLPGHRLRQERLRWRCYDDDVYAQRLRVELVIEGERRASPLEWLDQFCMRNFTNAAEFDDTLPLEDGLVEVSLRVTPERFAESFGAWLRQRGKGEGHEVRVEIAKLN